MGMKVPIKALPQTDQTWLGHPLWITDGSTVSIPDESGARRLPRHMVAARAMDLRAGICVIRTIRTSKTSNQLDSSPLHALARRMGAKDSRTRLNRRSHRPFSLFCTFPRIKPEEVGRRRPWVAAAG